MQELPWCRRRKQVRYGSSICNATC
jgi:hypothetical protein